MTRYHLINGEKVLFTAEEESARDAEEALVNAAASAKTAEKILEKRRFAYQEETDALFFEEQAGEVAAGTWAAKRAEIKARFPKD